MSKQKPPTIEAMAEIELHRRAMDAFDDAMDIARIYGHPAAIAEYRKALTYEAEAARRLAPRIENEPARSVIHRSAATMAFRCGEYRQAERLIAVALSGEPYEETAEELRDLLEEVNFARHLKLRGIALAKNEFQISLTGDAVGFGITESVEFVGRVQTTEKMVIRMYERSLRRPFRETGRAIKEISDRCQLYLSVPRAASFAITVRVGTPEDQPFLAGMEGFEPPSIEDTIANLVECFRAFEDDGRGLEELIPEEPYRRNFTALARQLAPDGRRIKSVGITSGSGDRVNSVSIRRPKSSIDTPQVEAAPPDQLVVATGILREAKATSRNNLIRIVDPDGEQTFYVPQYMMADVVRPFWETHVRVIGVRRGKRKVELQTIDPVRDDDGLQQPG